MPLKIFENVAEFIFKHIVQKSDGWIIKRLKMADSKGRSLLTMKNGMHGILEKGY